MDPIQDFRELRAALAAGDDRTAADKAQAILVWMARAGVVPAGMTHGELFTRIICAGLCESPPKFLEQQQCEFRLAR